MPKPLVTEQLSSEAQSILVACFGARMTAAATAAKILEATGEVVAERTVGRRKAEWEEKTRRRQAGREQMEDLLAAMRAGNNTAAEMVNALAIEALMRDPEGTLAGVDPIALQKTSLDAEKVRLQRDRQALMQRQIELEEKKFAALQEREQRAIEALKGETGGTRLSPEDTLRKVKEIYGLKYEDNAQSPAA